MVKITETILRDAHQSQAATRMRLDEMLPVAAKLDKVGYYSIECWGGATFDSCLRFLNEDPWERLRQLKKAMPNTKLQMLLRGQNILGYKHYADDVVDEFVKMSIKNGIDIIRIFDALNDTRNMKQAMDSCKKYGGICEATISYTTSPVHTNEYFIKLAKELEKMGADIICIKDMAGILLPYTAYELVKGIKKVVKVPVHLHTHQTSGTGNLTYLKAIEAGVDIIDCALSALGNGTSQPATEPMVAVLQGTEYDTGLDLKTLNELSSYFDKVADRLKKDGWLTEKSLKTDVRALIYQVPGGMLSNLVGQLKKLGAMDRYDEVLAEVPNVRKDLGYPPLVTPTSQIVGTQAVFNVISGERYKMVSAETKDVLRGKYGKLPAEPNPEIVKKVLGDEKPITCRPADLIKPELAGYRDEIKEYIEQEEDIKSILLLNAVIENGKLTNDEKELCYSLLPFYLDYDNLDRKGIYERLSTLDIIYIDEEVKVSATEVKGASYIPDSNIIICYNKKNIILKHELFHVSIPMTDFPKALKEGLVSELTKEYFYNENAKFSSTYREYMALINSFTYLIDSDTLIELASFNDLERFKEILLNKGSITENELDDIISLFDKQLGIKDRTKIVEELLESYDVLRNNPGALESLKVYNLYDSSKSADYYFNKSKIK